MTAATITGRLLGDEGKPVANHPVTLQVFRIARSRWETLADRTDAAGNIAMKLSTMKEIETAAPALRLIEDGTPATRVLSAGPMLRVDTRSQTLLVDFGTIERLDETAFRRATTSSATASVAAQVAGVPYRQEISTLAIGRLANRNPVIGMAVASAPTARAIFQPADETSRAAAVAAEAEIGRAFAVNKEIDTLKAREITLNSELLDKTRELSARDADLALERQRRAETESKLADVTAEAAVVKTKNDELLAGSTPLADVATVVTGIGTKLSDANQILKTGAVPFRIGNVKLDLRGNLSADGTSIALGAKGGDGQTSGLSTELQIDDRSVGDLQAVVPDVVGLTESATRRVLASVGLRLKTAKQTVAAGGGTPGQALMQHPAASASVAHGSDVLVVFAVATTQKGPDA